jgi:ACR3 family arsenite efflux pump ArsB
MAKGNVPLSASILPLNLILQLMLLPFFIWLFEGLTKAGTQTQAALAAIPILLTSLIGAKILAFLFKKRPKGLPRQLGLLLNQRFWLLFLAVAAMFAQYGGLVIERLKTFPNLLAAVIGFFFINLILVLAYTRLARFSYQDCASLCLTSLARNSPVALVVAAGAFPDRPMVSLTLIIGPLIELPVLALIAHVLRRYIAK